MTTIRLGMISIVLLLLLLPVQNTQAQDFCENLTDLDCVLLNQALANTMTLSGSYESVFKIGRAHV